MFLPFTHAWTKQRKARRGPGNTVWVSTSADSLSTLDLFIDLLWNQNWGGGGCDACPVDHRRLSESSCLPTSTTDSLSTLMLCIVYPSKLQQKSCLALSLSPHVISCTGAWERDYKYARRIPVLWAWVPFPTWHSVLSAVYLLPQLATTHTSCLALDVASSPDCPRMWTKQW